MVNEIYSVIYKHKQTKIPPDAQHRSLSANFCSLAQTSVLKTNSISKKSNGFLAKLCGTASLKCKKALLYGETDNINMQN